MVAFRASNDTEKPAITHMPQVRHPETGHFLGEKE